MVPEASAGDERRRHPRYDLMAQVRVKHGQVDTLMDLSNISRCGALMHMGKLKRPAWIAVGRTLEVGIIHPVDYQALLVTAAVTRVIEDDKGISVAVEFADLDDQGSEGIAQLVKLAKDTSEAPPATTLRRPPPLPKG